MQQLVLYNMFEPFLVMLSGQQSPIWCKKLVSRKLLSNKDLQYYCQFKSKWWKRAVGSWVVVVVNLYLCSVAIMCAIAHYDKCSGVQWERRPDGSTRQKAGPDRHASASLGGSEMRVASRLFPFVSNCSWTHHPPRQCQMTPRAPVCSPHINIIHADRESLLLGRQKSPPPCLSRWTRVTWTPTRSRLDFKHYNHGNGF